MPLARTTLSLALLFAVHALADDRGVDVRRQIAYSSPAGQDLLLDAYVPRGEGPFPAVVVIHGGSWKSGDRFQLGAHAWWFASQGIAAFSIDYRLAPDHKWPAQIHDCKAAVRWIKSHAPEFRVDPDRVGAYGYSAGGHLALLLGVADAAVGLEGDAPEGAPDTRVRAVAAGGAPVEFRDVQPRSRGFVYWLGATLEESPETYRLCSPAAHVDATDPPCFLFHGTADVIVSMADPRLMTRELESAGVEHAMHEVPLAGHIGAAMSPRAVREAGEFLLEHLR